MKFVSIPSRTRSGFSLIEMMAAMAVLSILMFVLLRVFGNSANAVTVGTGKSQQVSDARLALDLIASEMQNAAINIYNPIANPGTKIDLVSQDGGQPVTYELKSHAAENSGTGYDVAYTRNVLMKTPGGGTEYVFIDNLLDFRVVAIQPDSANRLIPITDDFIGIGAGVVTNQPPMVSIFIETLSEQDQIRSSKMATSNDRDAFEDRRSRRFTRTVLFRRSQAERF